MSRSAVLLVVSLAVVALAVVGSFAQTSSPSRTCDGCAGRAGTVRLGISAQLTYSSFSEARLIPQYISQWEGVRFGTWFLNKNGLTVQGVSSDVELYTLDNTGSPIRAADQLAQLSTQSNVDFFVADYSGVSAKAQFPKAKQLRRVIVSGGSGAVSNNDATNVYSFSVIPRQGAFAQEALDLFYDFVASGQVAGPLPVAILHRKNVDGLDVAAAVKDWMTANPTKAASIVPTYFPYDTNFFTGIASSDITALAVAIRDSGIRAIIGDASTADQQSIDGVLYNSNIILDLQAWGYDSAASTQYNQGIFVYSQWTQDLLYSSNRKLDVLWGEFQALLHPNVNDRLTLNQYAVGGFHAVMAIAAGVRSADSLDNLKVARALAAFSASNPIRNSDSLLINTPGQVLYFKNGQAVYRPELQQFSCPRVAAVGGIISPPEAATASAKPAFVGGTCYPKREVVLTYSYVGEFRLPQRSHTSRASGSSATTLAPAASVIVLFACLVAAYVGL